MKHSVRPKLIYPLNTRSNPIGNVFSRVPSYTEDKHFEISLMTLLLYDKPIAKLNSQERFQETRVGEMRLQQEPVDLLIVQQ